MNSIRNLLFAIEGKKTVYLQTHNFPDHDAIASVFALQYLLVQSGVNSHLIYDGEIQRDSLVQLIRELKIQIRPAADYPLTAEDKIIIVDGCKFNKNVTDLIGDEVGIIDHHEVAAPEDVRFVDIRPEYGACSSIIFSYFTESGTPLPTEVATALLCGLAVDTLLMTRGVCEADLEAYSALYTLSDIAFVNSNLRNYIQQKDLLFYKQAIERVRIQNRYAFCCFDEGCNQNLLGIIGDFFLALKEVDMVFLCAKNDSQINFSLRSEVEHWNAARIIQEILAGIGFGGGHADMAGGIIRNGALFDPEDIFAKLSAVLKSKA